MGFHLIDQTACFAVGQLAVRVCTVPNGRSTQGGKFWTWLGLCCHGGNVFLGGLHGLSPPQRQINGLQRCNSLLCCRAQSYLGSLAISMALQWLRQLSACMCRRPETWGQHQKKAGRWPWREKRCSWFRAPCRDFETTCTAFSSTKQVGGMLKTRDKTCGQPCG